MSHRYTAANGFEVSLPLALDVAAFAADNGQLQGEWPVADMPRLLSGTLPLEAWTLPTQVHWQARGQLKPQAGTRPQVWLHLAARCSAAMTCQRCLQIVHVPLEARRSYLFAATEALAAELDDELEDDVLVSTRSLNLSSLVEDELILALPLVPRHDDCSLPLSAKAEPPLEAELKANPFAALARLKRPD